MLESAVKCVYVDQALPGDSTLADRIALAGSRVQVPRSSVEVIDRVSLRMMSDSRTFISSVKSAFGALSGYTHLSRTQLEERFRRVEHGEFTGFERRPSGRSIEWWSIPTT